MFVQPVTPHPNDQQIRQSKDRTFQVWEVYAEGLIQFVTGAPEVTMYAPNGEPFQFSHPCYCIDDCGERHEWPLIETVDRPLEVKEIYKRLA